MTRGHKGFLWLKTHAKTREAKHGSQRAQGCAGVGGGADDGMAFPTGGMKRPKLEPTIWLHHLSAKARVA